MRVRLRSDPAKWLAAIAGGLACGVLAFEVHRALTTPPLPAADSDAPLVDAGEVPNAAGTRARSGAQAPFGRIEIAAAPSDGTQSSSRRAGRSADLEALRHPSASYRNTSLLALIRDAGHVCVDILSAGAGDEDAKVWRVSCEGAHVFLVSVGADGDVSVEPMPFGEFMAPVLLEQRAAPDVVPAPHVESPRPIR